MKIILILICLIPCLVFSQNWFSNGQNADLMVSGAGFNNTGGALLFNHPSGLASNGTNLILCDRFNNRILVWHTAPDVWNILPDIVLGQPNFVTNNPGFEKSQLNWPGNAAVSQNGKLAIADTNNDRLLLWNSFPETNGQPADISIRLPDICPPNTPLQWNWPWGVWTDGTRLAAIATQGSAILFWNSFPTEDNQTADYTISHPDFGTPRNISTDGLTYFFVGDHNAKVNDAPGTFFWNSYPLSSVQEYDFYRDEWIKGTRLNDGKLIASGLQQIYTWNDLPENSTQEPDLTASPDCYNNGDGVDVVEAVGKIYVCNYNGNDVLVYNSPPDNQNPDPLFALGIADYNLNSLDSIGYIQNPSFSTDGTRLIVTSDFDQRIYIYNQLPAISGQLPDQVISTRDYDLAAWDNTWFEQRFVAVGRNRICIWENATDLSGFPSQTFQNNIGSASFSDLKGVALDEHYLYVADRNGKLFIWEGIPANNTVSPIYSLDFGDVRLNRLSSDGTYLCVTQQDPAAIYIYKVADIIDGNTIPWKTINGLGIHNLPSEAITFDGSLAIANMGYNDVILWEDINQAPDINFMTIIGQLQNSGQNDPAIGQHNLFMPGALLKEGNHLWVGEHKFSSRILRYTAGSIDGNDNMAPETEAFFYPNPAGKYMQVVIPECLIGSVYSIYDSAGKLLIKENFQSVGSIIGLDRLSPGMYFLRYGENHNLFHTFIKF